MSRTCFVCRTRSVAIALAASGLLGAFGFVFGACAAPSPPGPAPASAPDPVPHPPANIIVVLPGPSTARFAQAKALTVALVNALEPGDEIIVAHSDFSLLTSQVVPGTRVDAAEVVTCGAVSVGGPSPRCQDVAFGRRRLERWRAGLIQQIDGVEATPTEQVPAGACPDDSGWPSRKVLQLLFAFGDDRDDDTLKFLILGGGDAGPRGDAPRLPAGWLEDVVVVDAPYVMGCGSPLNLEDWFHDAADLRLFSAERPASEFPRFLFQTWRSALAEDSR